ncbi:hypothetical protein Pcinc_009878 [Petrolisthes cinctipes]|uniref:T-cell activation inhibitor, mitochondrial n=1 Tax=Petrolisthes cinctipes TaxID=88211 RepID=A0AAE1G4G2_PETCI|nr:hypothetical protein Pcinc_009878 [Petrolisthes cinctipes]
MHWPTQHSSHLLLKWRLLSNRIFQSVNNNVLGEGSRSLTSAQVSTALRPFYFLVHPDFFGQHPEAQRANNASIQTLNSHLDSLIKNQKTNSVNLQFYVKNKKTEGTLNQVALKLNRTSARATLQRILSEFDLPTKYVDSLPNTPQAKHHNRMTKYDIYDHIDPFDIGYEPPIPKRKQDLYSWLVKNMGEAERRLAGSEPIRRDICRIRDSLVSELFLTQLTWQRGLGTTHLRGCLQGLNALTNHHQEINPLLEGRAIHFGNETGVSFDGKIVLSTSEVRNQWLKVICKLPEQDAVIQRIPLMQKAVSNALRGIQVTHRKYQPYVLVDSYIGHLKRLVTALGDYRGRDAFPASWPDSLKELQLVVESAAGPLMLSPTGQILAPSSCPPWLLVNFITENMEEAKKMIKDYESIRWREVELHQQCCELLELDLLDKDDSVQPAMMVQCLEQLVNQAPRLTPLLSGARVWITQYFAVMLDGEICIPWDF